MLEIYADESCKDQHKFLVIGAIAIDHRHATDMRNALAFVRTVNGQEGEVKWSRCTRQKLDFYKQFVDVFFDFSADDRAHFQGLYVDTSTFKHKKFNGGDRDLGFNKLIYQLLLHRFGRRKGADYPLHVFLDARATKQKPEDLRPMLNADLRRWGIATDPFRRITFVDSAKSDLVQLADLLVGTIGFTKNLHHRRDEAAAHKIELKQHIIRRALANEPTTRLNSPRAERFYVWPFRFNGRG
ncbi:MAG: DUF3800 domain-containing protein [Burkholderiales bacterium]|nr:DUF3800 domain-containing protein [Burkholderiales bacterium]